MNRQNNFEPVTLGLGLVATGVKLFSGNKAKKEAEQEAARQEKQANLNNRIVEKNEALSFFSKSQNDLNEIEKKEKINKIILYSIIGLIVVLGVFTIKKFI